MNIPTPEQWTDARDALDNLIGNDSSPIRVILNSEYDYQLLKEKADKWKLYLEKGSASEAYLEQENKRLKEKIKSHKFSCLDAFCDICHDEEILNPKEDGV